MHNNRCKLLFYFLWPSIRFPYDKLALQQTHDDSDTAYLGLDDFLKNKTPCSNDSTPCYNILAIDGTGMKGIVPAIVVDYMENKSYEYSLQQGYITEADYPKQKIHMSELFQMIAGSSTGSILAAALVIPKEVGSEEPSMYASDVVEYYEV